MNRKARSMKTARFVAIMCSITLANSFYLSSQSAQAIAIGGGGGTPTPAPTNIHSGSTVVIDLSHYTHSTLTQSSLKNAGTVYVVEDKGGATTATLNLGTLINHGVITSVLPASLTAYGYDVSHLVSNLSLVLNITTAMTNTGVIASAHNLTIVDTSLTGTAALTNATTGILAAHNNVNIQAPAFQNTGAIVAGVGSGVLAAALSSQNVLATITQNITSNLAGTISFSNPFGGAVNITSDNAMKGTLIANLVQFHGNGLQLALGDITANKINFDAGTGSLSALASSITGAVTASGASGTIGVNNGTLDLHSANFSNSSGGSGGILDPTFFDRGGNVVVNVGQLKVANADLNIYASGSILATANSIGKTIDTASGGMDLEAGVKINSSGVVVGKSESGGSIDLSGVNLTGANGNAYLALVGASSHSAINLVANGGQIKVGDISSAAAANSGLRGGNVSLKADGAISTGAINTSGATLKSGVPFEQALYAFLGGQPNAGDISIKAGGNIHTGTLTANGGDGINGKWVIQGEGVNGLAITNGSNGGNAGNIIVDSSNGAIKIDGNVTSIGGVGGNSGSASSSVEASVFGNNGGAGGNGGNIALLAHKNITAGNVQSIGGNGGNGGNAMFSTDNIGIEVLGASPYTVGSGGNGGNGGAIVVKSTDGTVKLACVGTEAGNGGNGGKSTAITLAQVVESDTWNAGGGNGGNGGVTGGITICAGKNIDISGQVQAFGGNGGDGGSLTKNSLGWWESAGNGGAGGSSGNISLDAANKIAVVGSVETLGGSGGNGGNANYGTKKEFWNETLPGFAGNGGNAANAGNIKITAEGNIKLTDVMSFGGNTGNGGNGNMAGSSGSSSNGQEFLPCEGCIDGPKTPAGGNSGSIFITSNNGKVQISGTVETAGGNGGNGGNGNDGNIAGLSPRKELDSWLLGSAGQAADGGKAKSITINGVEVMANNLMTWGGNGGNAGNGLGNSDFGSMPAGKGGAAGQITVNAQSLIKLTGTAQTAGGNGGDGGQFENGGAGGKSGPIHLNLQGKDDFFAEDSPGKLVPTISANNLLTFGGNGGNGGSVYGHGGKGGNGGAIIETLDVGMFKVSGTIQTTGGNGGSAQSNSRAGNGGKSGNIKFGFFLANFDAGNMLTLGGNSGGTGGKGGKAGNIVFRGLGASGSTGYLEAIGGAGASGMPGDKTAGKNGKILVETFLGGPTYETPTVPIPGMARVAMVPFNYLFCCNPVSGSSNPVVQTSSTTTTQQNGNTSYGPQLIQSGPNTVLVAFGNTITQLPYTDTTRSRTPNMPEPPSGIQAIILPVTASTNPTWVIATNNVQPYAFEDDPGSVILAAPGTIFAVTADHQITVKQGSVVVIADANVAVQTKYGNVEIPAGSVADVEQSKFGGVTVADLFGGASTFNVAYKGNTSTYTVNPNQALMVDSSSIATAGGSDFVPNLDKMASAIPGLVVFEQALSGSGGGFKDQIGGVNPVSLPFQMQQNLSKLLNAFTNGGVTSSGSSGPVSTNTAGSHLAPVAFTLPAAPTPTTPSIVKQALQTLELDGVAIKHTGDAILFNEAPDVLSLRSGEIVVDAMKKAVVAVGNAKVEVAPKTIALISRSNDVVKVRNLCETSAQSIVVTIGQRAIKLYAGQEMDLSLQDHNVSSAMKADGIARRRVETIQINGSHKVTLAEFSPVSLFNNDPLVMKLIRSQARIDRSTNARILRMAACLMQVTSGRGIYKRVASAQ